MLGLRVRSRHLLQMPQGNIAHAEKTGPASIALLPHRLPDLAVIIGPTMAGRRPVEYVAVEVGGSEMFERTGHRLRDLN